MDIMKMTIRLKVLRHRVPRSSTWHHNNHDDGVPSPMQSMTKHKEVEMN